MGWQLCQLKEIPTDSSLDSTLGKPCCSVSNEHIHQGTAILLPSTSRTFIPSYTSEAFRIVGSASTILCCILPVEDLQAPTELFRAIVAFAIRSSASRLETDTWISKSELLPYLDLLTRHKLGKYNWMPYPAQHTAKDRADIGSKITCVGINISKSKGSRASQSRLAATMAA